jgi:SDR family mycofactocin-dependent oxidoreductase
MSGKLANKVALITGAARGQGRSHAVVLAGEGADIVALDICAPVRGVPYAPATPEDLEETVRLVRDTGRNVVAEQVDVRDFDTMSQVVAGAAAQLGGLDIIVANAGITIMKPWDRVTPEIFADTIDINLTGVWNTVMAGAPHLVERGGGSVILTSSVGGLKGLPFLVPYVASKHGVTGLMKAFAHELAKHSIRVNSIHPTGVDTPMSMHSSSSDAAKTAISDALDANPRLRGMFTTSLPIEAVQVEDISSAVLFLASSEARYITALAMTVDAGHSEY